VAGLAAAVAGLRGGVVVLVRFGDDFRATAFRAVLRAGRAVFRRELAVLFFAAVALRAAAARELVRVVVRALLPRVFPALRRAEAPLRAAAFLPACFLAIAD
jgi:hypothetical protein